MIQHAPSQDEFCLRLDHLQSVGVALDDLNQGGNLLCWILRFIAAGELKPGWKAEVVVEKVIAAGVAVDSKALKLAAEKKLFKCALEIAKKLAAHEAE